MELKSDAKIQSVDSCVILRMLTRDIPEQTARARALLLDGHDYYVDDIAVMETVYVLTKIGWDREDITDSILSLLENPLFLWNQDFFEPIFAEYLRRPSLSFDDLALAARAEANAHLPLWTFDHKFANQSEPAALVPYHF